MGLKHLLVHVDSTDAVHERLDLAVKLARRFGARLTGLFAESGSIGASIVGRRSPQQLEEAVAKARGAFSGKTAGLDAEWWQVPTDGPAELIELTSALCRYADLAIFGQHDPGTSRLAADVLEGVVLDCGRPVLVIPSAGHHPDVGKRVVVGWNASRESARAVNDAIPLMKDAQFVGILAFLRAGSPLPVTPARIATHLALHGIHAEYERQFEVKDGIGPSDALLNYASESGADLTVMGVPGRSFPLRQPGSTARELLRSMTTPMLLAS